MRNRILFYRVRDQYGEFSNFAPYPINIRDVIWPTSEHYFQSRKSDDPFYIETILNADTPSEAKKLGRSCFSIRNDWEKIKFDIMHEAVYAKFSQYPELRELLLATGTAEIVEHTKNDNIWADGGDGSGLNWLGEILMLVRSDLNGANPLL